MRRILSSDTWKVLISSLTNRALTHKSGQSLLISCSYFYFGASLIMDNCKSYLLTRLAGTRGLRPQIDLNLPQKMHQFISSTTVHLPTHLLYQHGCSSTRDTGVTQYWDIIAYFSRFFDTTRGSIFEGLKWSFFGQFSRFFFHLIYN